MKILITGHSGFVGKETAKLLEEKGHEVIGYDVMQTKTGARLLDFGLARLTAHGEQPAVESLTSAPTEAESTSPSRSTTSITVSRSPTRSWMSRRGRASCASR